MAHPPRKEFPATDLPDARPTAALKIWKTQQETWLRPYLEEWPAGIESALDNSRFKSTKPFRDHLTESLRQRSIEAMLLRDGRFITERSPTFPMGQ